jgi:SAM-dependent methyltransferase
MADFTWEQAVQWLRDQPDQQELVRACYFDDPLLEAAERFAGSDEWQAVRALLTRRPGHALDMGAGRGISSYALARDGWQVTALEPDPSSLVGGGAIRTLAEQTGLPITLVEEYGEKLPFADQALDLVYGRQVLHHARDLAALCREAARVLKPGGRFVATREHVISQPSDLQIFLDSHPLQRFYGGENAFLLSDYTSAIRQSGLRLVSVLGPFDSVINYFPMSRQLWRDICLRPLVYRVGRRATFVLASEKHPLGRWLVNRLAHRLSQQDRTPGRLYSFVAEKK